MGGDVFFILMGAILVFAMHGGFAFLEVGTVRSKNQVNALVKILSDFALSVLGYFFIGYMVAYGVHFFHSASALSGEGGAFQPQGYDLVKFFFLVTFAAAIPAIISGGIAERARFYPQLLAVFFLTAFIYPFFEGIVWNGNFGFQSLFEELFGSPFHDFAGSVVVHGVGGSLALAAVLLLGPRKGRYEGSQSNFHPSSIPWLALGSWLLCIGWFGFNVMSAQKLGDISGLVAMNSLLAMAGGILAALIAGRNDPGFIHNGALAGLVAICAGSDVVHPMGALVIGGVAGVLFVHLFTLLQNKWRIDDVLGVFPLHGACGIWGGIAAGIFGAKALGGMGGVSFLAQLFGSLSGALYAFSLGLILYGLIKTFVGIRLSEEDEEEGSDLAVHKTHSEPPFGTR